MTYTLVHNATLIDGTGQPPVEGAGVLLEGNRIRAAGPLSALPVPAGEVTRIDAAGGYILPGLIDCHVHLMYDGFNLNRYLASPFSLRFFLATQTMRRTLDAGITSVRDAGAADLGVKQAVESGLVEGPRLQISISILTITGGHTDFWMVSNEQMRHLFGDYPGCPGGICDGPDEVRKKVREVLRAGADIIKICTSGGVLSPTDHPDYTQFSPAEIEAAVEEARFRRGVKVMAHAQGTEGIKNAVRAGVHSIEHGIYLDDEAIELMLERGTFLVPTLWAVKSVLEMGPKLGISEHGIRKAAEVYEGHCDSIRRAHKAGVRIAMGTDAGVMPHGTNLRELGLMCDAGMSPMEAIVATTKVAAECLGWQDRVGTVEPGKLADLIICRTNPLADIQALGPDQIEVVIKDGRVVKRQRPAV